MSSTKTPFPTTPLIPKPTPSPESIPPSSTLAINTLALGRIALGISSILAPSLTFRLFGITIPAALMVLPRMFGVRELMVGEFLWAAENKRETRKALWMGVGVDAVDFASVAYGVSNLWVNEGRGGG